jgi:hypothetical protein
MSTTGVFQPKEPSKPDHLAGNGSLYCTVHTLCNWKYRRDEAVVRSQCQGRANATRQPHRHQVDGLGRVTRMGAVAY